MGQVTGSPHTCGAFVDISRRMIQQSTPSAEQFIRNEIIERVARTVQIAVFAGAGTAEPWAITHTTGINNPSVTQGTPTYAELLGFPGNIMSDNASADNMKWAMTGEVWQKLAATFTDGTAKAEHVLDYNSKTCLGFPYLVSEDVGANSLFFGNWAMVVVGVWGNGVDLKVDDVTLDLSGGVRLIGLQDVDVMVRHGQALAYNAAVTS
jgi:HK97 family phage major capsid protein